MYLSKFIFILYIEYINKNNLSVNFLMNKFEIFKLKFFKNENLLV